MIRTYKVMLKPNNKQKTKLFECAGLSRWAYNWTLGKQKENYNNGGKFLKDSVLRKELTKLKKIKEYSWLNQYSNNITKQAIKDACNSYKRFFKGYSSFPRFKSKRKSKPSFYQDNIKIKFTKTHVKLEKLTTSKKKNRQKFNWIRLVEKGRIPTGEDIKYSNPRVGFDGLNWWISVGVKIEEVKEDKPKSEPIGIDLGVKDLAIISNGEKYKNINKSSKMRKLIKRYKRLQRQISRKYDMSKTKIEGGENCYKYHKTKNIIKAENKLKRLYKKIKGLRDNYIHQVTNSLVKAKPNYIVIEDLNISGMLKNKKLSKAIQEQSLREFRRQLEYKCKWNDVKLIVADRYYPSSKLCSLCGYIHKDLKLSDRIYKCPKCGNKIDRDYQASINLREYPKSVA
ncbi:RNA-guided endonuclease InsQ/TnpB family protein [Clostridiisalibacter paucivorans]|uniref:RNA-guided endonuclease InsQ/TnpB family protein n=1 Tax=Clostridiisalibacter paucivorans TaxID=408753 RepID=UPI00047C8F88|nr:RNA-guided endonuclease TnpB family protein [Clostridiisalibacter paucivorans]